jgi:hypothetical protein
LLLVGLLFAFQDRLLFQPASTLGRTPDQVGLGYETVYVDTEDGQTLHGWWIPGDGDGANVARETLLFFHGNAGTIAGRLENVRQFHEIGLNVLIFDYRGYGKSTGDPSETGLYQDAEAMWTWLTESRGVEPSDVVLFARSMGGGPASWLAVRTSPRAVILESVFTSVPDIAAHHYPFLPARQLARIQFDVLARVPRFDAPLLVIHSREDRIVPFSHGQQLYEAATEPKQFLEIEGGHNNGFWVSAKLYTESIRRFLAEAR